MGKKNKKKNKNKGKEMGWWKKTEKAISTFTRASTLTKPDEYSDSSNLNIVLFKQSTLDKIAEICLPKAGGSEFQVHYRGIQIVIEHTDGKRRMIFTIPTVFFNMPQKVSSGSVDFNLDEVAELSNQVQPISAKMAEEMINHFPIAFFQQRGFNISVRELEMGSMHRHPGNFGFSQIDLDNQVEKPGVIFRNKNTMNTSAGEKIQVDSVMYIPNKSVKLVTTETRIVKVKPAEDGGIEGAYYDTPTISYIIKDVRDYSDFEDFFNPEAESETKTVIDFEVAKKWTDKVYSQAKDIFQVFLENYSYEPQIIIDPDMIEQAYRSYYSGGGTYYGKNKYGNYGNTYTPPVKHSTRTIPVKDGNAARTLHKPKRETWRKNQTMSLLRSRQIDLKDFPEVDGSGSKEDMIGIVRALKKANYDDNGIRTFLKLTGYNDVEVMDLYYDWLAKIVDEKGNEISSVESEEADERVIATNIQQLLRNPKDDEDLFDTIEILFDSEMEIEDIRKELEEAGHPADEILKKYFEYQQLAKPKMNASDDWYLM